jgi:NADPH:quinone reductase-like Zn-dependent oxidoreductase
MTGGEDGGSLTGGLGRQLKALAMSPFVRQRLTMFIGTVRTSDLLRLSALVGDGTLTPSIDRTFPLAQAPEALRRLEAGEVRGKVALTV